MNIDPAKLLQFIGKATSGLKYRILLMISRAVVRTIRDDEGLQRMTVEIFKGDLVSNIERFQNYGFTSNPIKGADALVGFLGGSRDHGIVICVDDRRYRLKDLDSGEVAMYTDEGDFIWIKRGGTVSINAATKIEMITALVTMSGALTVGTDLTVTGKWGCNSKAPQASFTVNAAATNNGEALLLVNQLRNALINNGTCI